MLWTGENLPMTTEFPTPAAPLNATGGQEAGGEGRAMFEVPFLSTVCVLGVVGNFFVLTVYTRRRYRRSNAALYILNLALGDILALVVVLFHITEFFEATWPILWRADAQCQVHRYFRFVAFDLTVFNMVAIAIDRYFAVVHPLRFRLTFSDRRTKIICLAIWVLALAAAIPTAFMFKAPNYDSEVGIVTYDGKLPFACKVITPFGPWWPEFKSIYLNIVLCYVPTLLTAVIYVVIILKIRRANRPQHTAGPSQAGGADLRRKSWKSARMLLVVFVAYVVCYGSFATYNVLSRYTDNSIPAVIYNVCLLLPYANSCMNPIIYSFANPSFRKACRELLCRRQRLRKFGRETASKDDILAPAAVSKVLTNGACSRNGGPPDQETSFLVGPTVNGNGD